MTEHAPSTDPSPPARPDATTQLTSDLAQAERDEEWALIVLVGWLGLLGLIVLVLLLSPVPWGALIGLVVGLMGIRPVFRNFSAAVARTRDLRGRVEALRG